MAKEKQVDRFCKCIKSVRRSVKLRPGQRGEAARESAAIAICVKSVLQTRGRTLRSFKCKNGKLKTQKLRR
jgi:hypothetical protein